MAYPDKPSLAYSYSAFQQAQGDNTFPGTQVDADLAILKAGIDTLNDFVRGITRSDGKIGNGSVTRESLDPALQLGFNAPKEWVAGTAFVVNDSTSVGNVLYLCIAAHTASASFATDLGLDRWLAIADFSAFALADGAVTSAKIAALAVTAAKIADSAVEAAKIASGAVTAVKIAAGAIESDKLATDAVTGEKLADGAVGSAHLLDGAVTGAKLDPAIFATAENFLAALTGNLALTPSVVWAAAVPVSIPYAATVTLDLSLGINFLVGSLTGNVTLANPSNRKFGQSGMIVFRQDPTGSRAITFGSHWKFPKSAAKTLTTTGSSTDVLFYQVLDNDEILCSLQKGYA